MTTTRRQFLAFATAATTSIYLPRANAIAPLLPIIVPTVLAGIFGVWATRESAQSLELARERLAWEMRQAELNQFNQVLLTLLQQNPKFAETILANSPVLQSMAIDARGQRINAGISNSCDGRGTYLGLQNGQIALERSKFGGLVTNQEGVDLGDIAKSSSDPVAVPVLPARILERKESDQWKARISEKKGLRTVKAFDEDWNLLATRSYSRAQRITGSGADVRTVAIVPRKGDSQGKRRIEFFYET